MGVGVATDHPHYQKAMNNCSVPAVHHFFPPLMHPSQHPPISCFPFLHFSSLRIFKHSHTINLPKHREKQPPVNFFQTFSHFRCSMNILGVALLGGGKTPGRVYLQTPFSGKYPWKSCRRRQKLRCRTATDELTFFWVRQLGKWENTFNSSLIWGNWYL